MRVLSLYDGIACGYQALKELDIKVTKYYAFEIDKFAIEVAKKNHSDIHHLGDVFNIELYQDFIGEIDLIIGGSPCTHWSSAKVVGRETTPDGEGGKLFMQFVKAIEIFKPKYFLYENNNSMHKDIKSFITSKLKVGALMINSVDFVPQVRRRLYWSNIPFSYCYEQDERELIDLVSFYEVDEKYTLSDKMTKYALSSGTKTFYVKPEINLKKARPLTTAPNKRAGTTTYISVDFFKGGTSDKIRRLTPVEFERLQMLPDNYTFINGHKFEDSKRYKAIGNGWTIGVIKQFFINLKEEQK